MTEVYCFHCFRDGWELIKSRLHSTSGSLLIVLSLIDDGRLRAPSVLRIGVVPELWGP